MNIFCIPSWYPSYQNPIYGTFVQEQIKILAHENPSFQFYISQWGQGDPKCMLWIREPLSNIKKIFSRRFEYEEHQGNRHILCNETLTWTRKIAMGNLAKLKKIAEIQFLKCRQYQHPIRIIHAQASYPASAMAAHLSQKYRIPFVVTIRMSPFPFDEFLNKKGSIKKIIRRPLSKAQMLIATSHSLNKTLQNFGFRHVTTVHNPVDTELFKPKKLPAKALQILIVGRMEHQKGMDLFIRALAQLGAAFEGTVKIGGEGSLKKEWMHLAHTLGVADKIIWLGALSRREVADEMQKCSFYVLSSRHETFGNVLLEALSSGKPVVATRCGGPEDIVTKEVGILCDNNNVEALAKGILAMQKIYLNFNPLSLRAYVLNHFSPQIFSQNMTSIYQNLVY